MPIVSFKDELIAKLDEANNLNHNLKNQFSSQVDKIKSLEEQIVESKTEVEKLTSSKLVVEPSSKEKYFYIPPFKRNNEELKANIARQTKVNNLMLTLKFLNLCLKLILG